MNLFDETFGVTSDVLQYSKNLKLLNYTFSWYMAMTIRNYCVDCLKYQFSDFLKLLDDWWVNLVTCFG